MDQEDWPEIEIQRRVIQILTEHQSPRWLSEAGLAITDATRFCELLYDAVDEVCVATRLEDAFDIPCPPSLAWPETVGGLVAYVRRALERGRRLEIIRDFFGSTWRPSTDKFVISGWALIERIRAFAPNRILDLGCGDNQFKPHLDGLIGLDVANPKADIRIDFLRYDPGSERFDVIIALGSINFGSEQSILDELRHVICLLAPGGRIVLRVNPGIAWPNCPELEIFPWSVDRIHAFGRAVGLEVEGRIEEDSGPNGPRLVFVYRRPHRPSGVDVSALPRRPSALRAAWNRQRHAWLLPALRNAVNALAGPRIGERAPLPRDTDKIIWVTFPPGLSGHAVARMISASPEVLWLREVQGIEPLEIDSPHDWHNGQAEATCHYATPAGLPTLRSTDNEILFSWPFSNRAGLRDCLRCLPRRSLANLAAHTACNRPFVQTTHVTAPEIRRLFPNCPIVVLTDRDPFSFWLRAFHQKLNMRLWPHELQNEVWRGRSLAAALSASRVQVPLHRGRPLSFLQHQMRDLDPRQEDVRRYYRRLVQVAFAEVQERQAEAARSILVDRSQLFSPATWRPEYGRMCSALGITPVSEAVGAFRERYMDRQWRRPLPAPDHGDGAAVRSGAEAGGVPAEPA